ncbi:hypothetical protein, partial [Salmonella enterica]
TVLGRWDFLSVTLTVILPAVFALAAFLSFMRVRNRPWNTAASPVRVHGFTAAMSVFFLALAMRGLSGYGYHETAVDLAFPFDRGEY